MAQDDPVAALLPRVAAGEVAAFEAVWAAAADKLFGTLLRLLHGRGEAEAALEEVFLDLPRQAHRFDPARMNGIDWLVAQARARALDRLRRRPDAALTRDEALLDGVSDAAPGIEDRIVAHADAQRIEACLATLGHTTAEAIKAAYFQGLSYPALARAEDKTLPEMRLRLRRGLIALRGCLDA
jgi:RNA polymerase sigma-70 factor (ECF subfamily)